MCFVTPAASERQKVNELTARVPFAAPLGIRHIVNARARHVAGAAMIIGSGAISRGERENKLSRRLWIINLLFARFARPANKAGTVSPRRSSLPAARRNDRR
jgi:hypothetical protein